MDHKQNAGRTEKLHDLIRQCWTDAAFKARLLADPAAVLREIGWDVPAGKRIVFVENTPSVLHITLPPAPPVAELDLTPEQMDQVADRGGAYAGTHATVCYSCGTENCTVYGCGYRKPRTAGARQG